MRLVDAHCHLESEELARDLDQHVEAARRAGVVALVTASTLPEEWAESLALAARYPEVRAALGVHPWYVRQEHLPLLEGLAEARAKGAVAVGEIGLDSKTERAPMPLQLEAFRRQLAIARDLDLPVVLHCRGAFGDLLRVARADGLPRAGGLVHAFSGSAELVRELRPLGLRVSLGGTLTYRDSRKRAAMLAEAWPGSLLLETDAPDIPPVEVRAAGGPNLPAHILYNLRAAAEILGEPEERVAAVTTDNARELFGLELP